MTWTIFGDPVFDGCTYHMEVAGPAPDRINVYFFRCPVDGWEVVAGEPTTDAAIQAHVAEHDGDETHTPVLSSEQASIPNPHAGEITDEQGNPYNLRKFERSVDDPRNEGLDHDGIMESLREEAREQIARETAPETVEPDPEVVVLSGAGEAL